MNKIIAFTKNGRGPGGRGFDGERQVPSSGEGYSGAFMVFARLGLEGLGSESNLTIPACPPRAQCVGIDILSF